MNLSFFFARRYLFSRKSHSAINIISGVSALGIAVSTMALVCVLSVFNGFRELIAGLYSAFDPEIELVPTQGKYADANDAALLRLNTVGGIAETSACFQENALILYKGNPLVVTLKGVDDHFASVTGIDSIVYNAGNVRVPLPALSAAGINYAVPGYGLAARMGIDFGQIEICAPRRGEQINMVNPGESFNVDELFSSSTFFQVNQKTYDDATLLTSLSFAQNLFEQPGKITSLLLRVKPNYDVARVQQAVQQAVGSKFKARNRMEQHDETFKVMKIEKLMAYLFLTFIVLVACFNLIGSVAMLIIDKRRNAATLNALGMDSRAISSIFLYESRLITLIGALAGILLGVLLCSLQAHFGLIRLGNGEGNFIVDAYPVSTHWQDVLFVFFTVLLVGFTTVWYPVRYLCRKML